MEEEFLKVKHECELLGALPCIFCLQNFGLHACKWNSLFREKDDLNLTDTNSSTLSISLNFTEERALVFMRNSHSLAHLQSVTAGLQQNKDLWTDPSLQLPNENSILKSCLHCTTLTAATKGLNGLKVFLQLAQLLFLISELVTTRVCIPPSLQYQLSLPSSRCYNCFGMKTAEECIFGLNDFSLVLCNQQLLSDT